MDDLTRPGRCVRCGADLPGGTTEGLCPACLMAAAIGGHSSEVAADATTVISSSRDRTGRWSARLTAGQAFGPYLIGRLLGRGGMGEVYEAEHVASGRRIALKVLNQQLAGPEDRARFLREGQLAASINHPHAVYIFGSEDIGGTPVISMELVPGGTLKDRVEQHGPVAPSLAVDAILDVIAGLDAAHAGGILHRDVKPSNCFVDASGSVKVGDFGLSISTLARDVSELTHTGTFQGTPQYAALEQLRGQPLDVRADIYAVGATLYYLLTGRPPFDDRDLATLVARIASEPPPSPREGRPTVPQGLAAVVLRCLAKDRSARYGSYSELDDALRPFSSERPTPATLGLRFVAGLVDKALLLGLTAPLAMSPRLELVLPATVNIGVTGQTPDGPAAPLFVAAVAYAVTLAYYALLEGLGDASVGKRLCGLRVSGGGARPGVWRALFRTIIFTAPVFWPLLFSKAVGAAGPWPVAGAALFVINNSVGWILFTSMRRRNGYAGWHDLASGTRVVAKGRLERPAALEIAGVHPVRDPRLPRRVGPYDVNGFLGSTPEGELGEGFDPALRRRVWLHILRPGAPAIAPALRDLDRPGRLRWLSGRRLADDAWDAFDAPDGAPLLQVAATRQPWSVVRSWLGDLARELEAAERDGTTPRLALDRVWITRGSRALLLDVVPSGAPARPSVCESVPQLLAAVAKVGLDDEPLPLSARAFLTACESQRLSPNEIVGRLNALALEPVRVSPWRRGLAIGLTNLPAVVIVLAMLASAPFVLRVSRPDFFLPFNCLIQISKLEAGTDDGAVRRRRAFEQYCSATYGATYANEEFWNDERTRPLLGPLRSIGERVRANASSLSPAEIASAAADAGAAATEQGVRSTVRSALWTLTAVPLGACWFILAIVCLASAMIVPGGVLMRLLGIAVVNQRGQLVSRLGGCWRVLVAWSPVLASWGVFRAAKAFGHNLEGSPVGYLLVLAVLIAMVSGAVRVLRRPLAGWHDRLCGTHVVPR